MSVIDYIWIDEAVVHAVHHRQISEHGGHGGLRDEGLLVSALARPGNLHTYNPEVDIFSLAVAYGAGLVKNHAFIDGNKRTAYITMRLFMVLNGVDIQASQEEKYKVMMALASGQLSEDQLSIWLREKSVDIENR